MIRVAVRKSILLCFGYVIDFFMVLWFYLGKLFHIACREGQFDVVELCYQVILLQKRCFSTGIEPGIFRWESPKLERCLVAVLQDFIVVRLINLQLCQNIYNCSFNVRCLLLETLQGSRLLFHNDIQVIYFLLAVTAFVTRASPWRLHLHSLASVPCFGMKVLANRHTSVRTSNTPTPSSSSLRSSLWPSFSVKSREPGSSIQCRD